MKGLNIAVKTPHPDGLNGPLEIIAQDKSWDTISGWEYPLCDNEVKNYNFH